MAEMMAAQVAYHNRWQSSIEAHLSAAVEAAVSQLAVDPIAYIAHHLLHARVIIHGILHLSHCVLEAGRLRVAVDFCERVHGFILSVERTGRCERGCREDGE